MSGGLWFSNNGPSCQQRDENREAKTAHSGNRLQARERLASIFQQLNVLKIRLLISFENTFFLINLSII